MIEIAVEMGVQVINTELSGTPDEPEICEEMWYLYYMHKIVDGLLRENDGKRVPVTLFTKGGGQWLEAMAETGCDALGLDWTTDISDARQYG